MKQTATVRVVPLLLLLHYVSGNRISCISSGSVAEGKSASVTCQYHTDIEKNKIDFYVFMYSSSKGDPDVSAICAWEDDVLSCEMLPGYEVQMHGNTITLNITSAKKSHAGIYSCRVLQPSRDVSVDDCNLSVEGNRISCTSSGSVAEGKSASVTCQYHTDIEKNKIDFYVFMYSSSKGDPDVSAICAWEDDVLSCEMLPGYEVQMHGNTITLNITSAKKSHAGRYSCRVLQPSRDVSVDDCNLSVEVSGKLGKSEEKTISNGVEMQCHAQPHHIHGQPTTIMCFVPEFLNASIITLERREPSGHTTRVEILRCSKEEDSCILNIFGYKIRRKHNPLDGFRVIAVMVDRPGLYVCTADWGLTQSCMVEVYEDLQKATAENNSGQQLGVPVYAILGVSLFLLVAALLFSIISFARFMKIQTKHKTMLKKEDVDDIDKQEDGDEILSETKQTLHHKRCSI